MIISGGVSSRRDVTADRDRNRNKRYRGTKPVIDGRALFVAIGAPRPLSLNYRASRYLITVIRRQRRLREEGFSSGILWSLPRETDISGV